MSLVSVSNFLSPIRNKVQIVSLLVLAFLVFVVRWVGSSSSQPGDDSLSLPAARREAQAAAPSLKALQLETAAFLNEQAKPSRSSSAPNPLPGDESIEELLAQTAPAEGETPSDAAPPARNKDLADIRKKLGLE